jgi:hypothetical protein
MLAVGVVITVAIVMLLRKLWYCGIILMAVYVYSLRHIAFVLGHLPLWRGLVINFENTGRRI